MFSLISSSAVKWVAILAIVLGLAGAGWYVTSLKANLAISQENSKKLMDAVQLQQSAIDKLREDHNRVAKAHSDLRAEDKIQQKELNSLKEKFNQSASGKPRDVAVIAARKPELVESIINKATANSFRCMEIATGAPLTKEEQNAVKPNEINSSCTSIANPSYTASNK
jgi:multidrug resistance efflux pump